MTGDGLIALLGLSGQDAALAVELMAAPLGTPPDVVPPHGWRSGRQLRLASGAVLAVRATATADGQRSVTVDLVPAPVLVAGPGAPW